MRLRVAHSERGESTEREEKREAFPLPDLLPAPTDLNTHMKIHFHNSEQLSIWDIKSEGENSDGPK